MSTANAYFTNFVCLLIFVLKRNIFSTASDSEDIIIIL